MRSISEESRAELAASLSSALLLIQTDACASEEPDGALRWARSASTRSQFTKIFQQWMTRGFLVIVVVQLTTATAIGFQLVHSSQTLDWVAMARMLQLSLGIFVGFFMICLGLFAAWIGLDGTFTASFRASGARASLAGATPGISLMAFGTIILGVCLFKPVEMSDKQIVVPSGEPVSRAPKP